MGRKRKNTFSKALGHLKSSKITEAAPVNSTTGVYSITPGTLTRVEPGPDVPDYSTIDWDVDGSDGKDTSGLFDSNGDSKFIAPPGDNSYILGPMAAMYYTWSYPWTMVGYIREADRRMVNLGRIDGKLGDWDGSSGNAGSGTGTFYSYGQLTTEQALWFRDTQKKDDAGNDPANANYRAFYPGPPSNTPDAFGRYYCTITGTPLAQKSTDKTVAPIDLQATDILSAILDRQSKGISLSNAEKEYLKGQGFGRNFKEIINGLNGLYGENTFSTNSALANPLFNINILNQIGKGIFDNVLYGHHTSNYLLKGIPAGHNFTPFWTGGGPTKGLAGKIFKGRKLVDFADDQLAKLGFQNRFVKNIVGKNYFGQWFTHPTQVTTATHYGKTGTVSLVPRTGKIWSWKNWFSTGTGRSLGAGPLTIGTGGHVETFVRQSTLEKVLGWVGGEKGHATGKAAKRLDLPIDNPKTQKLLRRYATKVATNSKTLKWFARGIPIIGGAISLVDAGQRFARGDWQGGVLSVLSAVPGPAGYYALGAQVAYDFGAVDAAVNKVGNLMYNLDDSGHKNLAAELEAIKQGRNESFFLEENDIVGDTNLKEAREQMIKMGVPLDNPQAYADEVGLGLIASGLNPEIVQIIQLAIVGAELTPKQQKDIASKMMQLGTMSYAQEKAQEINYQEPLYSEDEPWGELDPKGQQTQESVELSESRKNSIIKNLKQPTVLPETKQKSYKVNPGRRLKTNFQGMDKLVNDITTQEPFKRKADVWSKDWQGYNSRLSQDKKNMVLELIGDGKHYFDYMLSDSKIRNAEEMEKFWGLHPEMHSYFYNGKKHKTIRKEEVKGDMIVFMEDENGVKSTILQSELNLILEAEHEKEMLDEYNKLEPTPFFKDPLMKKVAKRLKNEIEYEGKPAVKGYPDEPPPKMVKGFHPKFGKTYKYDKLDPVSAVMMRQAPTGDQVIDANVEKAAKKPKVKVKEERSDWRKDLEELDIFKEQMTTSGVFSYTLDASNDDIHTTQSGFDGEAITAVTNFTDIALVNDPHDMGTNIRNNQDPNLVPTNSDANHTAYTTSSGLEGDSGGFRGIDWSSTSTVTNENQPVDTNIVTGSDGPYMGNEIGAHLAWGSPGNPGYPRFAALKAVDTTEVDTISINWFTKGLVVSDGEGGYVARDDTDFTEPGDGIYLFYWAGDKEGAAQYAGDLNASIKDHDGWRPVNVKPDGTTDSDYSPLLIPHKAEGYKGNRFFKNDLTLPPWTRDKNTRFILVQIDNHTGIHKSRWGMSSVRFRRQFPMSITPLLDDPQASSFIRVGSSPQERSTSPTKRRKKVDKILKSSKKYVNKVVSDPFPGTESVVGEAQGTSKDPYIAQQWNDKKQEFADVGTLDQQKEKFVSKDVKLPPNYFDIQNKFKK